MIVSDQTVTAKVEGSELIMERIVAAPRDLVFKVFSSQLEHLDQLLAKLQSKSI